MINFEFTNTLNQVGAKAKQFAARNQLPCMALGAIVMAGSYALYHYSLSNRQVDKMPDLEPCKPSPISQLGPHPAGINPIIQMKREAKAQWPKYSQDFVICFALKMAQNLRDPAILQKIESLSTSHQIVIGLFMIRETCKNSVKKFHTSEFLPNIVSCIDEIDVTTEPAELMELWNLFQIIQLRRPNSDRLLLGCGQCTDPNAPCWSDHSKFDTIDKNLFLSPEVVADLCEPLTLEYFKTRSPYDGVIDEGVFFNGLIYDNELYFSIIESLLKKEGTLTVPMAALQDKREYSDRGLKIIKKTGKFEESGYRPDRETYGQPAVSFRLRSEPITSFVDESSSDEDF